MNIINARQLASFALIFALMVVMLGAYTRLTDAGLGCPDWPGCYGRMVLPSDQGELTLAQQSYPEQEIESSKAWTEMIHRYAAGSLAFMIFILFVQSVVKRFNHRKLKASTPTFTTSSGLDGRELFSMDKTNGSATRLHSAEETLSNASQQNLRQYTFLPGLLIGLVLFQAVLGMWTVTLKLLPVVVMSHLLGGILIFSCLCYYRLQLSLQTVHQAPVARIWLWLGLVILFVQIALGGWVSSNYAGIACVGFPTCNGQWWPGLNFSEGFNLFSPVGMNYQGGVLASDIRASIQFIHRLGAMISATYISILCAIIFIRSNALNLRLASLLAIMLVFCQFTLGVINVVYILPLWASVLHNGVAAILFATLLSLIYLTSKPFDTNVSKGEMRDASRI